MNTTLKTLRDKRGLSQSAVADFIGISRQMYNKYETGEVEPSLKAAKALCTLYTLSFDELFGDKLSDSRNGLSESKTAQPDLYEIKDTDCIFAEPSAAYGTQNVLNQILSLLPKLLYSEKAKLLTTVAQSMSNDVEAARLAQNPGRAPHLDHNTPPRQPTYEEWKAGMEKSQKLAESVHFSSHGIKWTREDMHER
ncbi:MAG: helix-turn-helix transcriptional regulator [Treponema sp.]|nr:helix-turn-helix transcriptional regulator [Candidatus Treponema caballi]